MQKGAGGKSWEPLKEGFPVCETLELLLIRKQQAYRQKTAEKVCVGNRQTNHGPMRSTVPTINKQYLKQSILVR